jgi:hypothetical protein
LKKRGVQCQKLESKLKWDEGHVQDMGVEINFLQTGRLELGNQTGLDQPKGWDGRRVEVCMRLE